MCRFKVSVVFVGTCLSLVFGIAPEERIRLKEEAKEMFYHAYNAYMLHAYPADELMPLSCKGRYRDTEPSRGDVDDSLGNFSLTLIDTLDTLVIIGDLKEFERATRLIIKDVSFDNDVVVSVFETNIRVLGGLLSGHIMASYLQERLNRMLWYRGELLSKAKDLGYRLLPAFNSTTGVPHPRINLMHGLKSPKLGVVRETCTACAGTMILEMAALSRLTGETIFEEKARSAMDYLWQQRHRTSDLMGTVLNIHNGDWVRRDSGVGAGIDSYYEYCLKAYILLGDDIYLDRFNKHYSAVMKYISQGPLLVDVHMHRPHTNSKNFMDSLLAFWPGLQVLKGDIKPAIETHEMLYQVMQRHNFLPEAFTTDFQVHWGQHPLRPEFLESTYFLYKATSDPYYLEVGVKVMESLQQYARVPCGFAAVKDVRTGSHEDRMDSFVLAETFKYLYLLFADKEDLIFDVDDFVFTTEAHLLPLSLARLTNLTNINSPFDTLYDEDFTHSCPNNHFLFPEGPNFAQSVRQPLKNLVEGVCPTSRTPSRRIHATEFQASNQDHLKLIQKMGINVVMLADGRIQLVHNTAHAETTEDAEEGVLFMQEMIELSKTQAQQDQRLQAVYFTLPTTNTRMVLNAGPAQFGMELKSKAPVQSSVVVAKPLRACADLQNSGDMSGKIVVVERGDCMFVEKARRIQKAGGIAGIVLDNNPGSSCQHSSMFAMSGDGKDDITIPVVFLFSVEGSILLNAIKEFPRLIIGLAESNALNGEKKVERGEAHVEEIEGIEAENISNLSGNSETKISEEKEVPTPTSTSTQPPEVKPTDSESESESEKRVLQLINRLKNLKKIKFDLDQLLTLTRELQEDDVQTSSTDNGRNKGLPNTDKDGIAPAKTLMKGKLHRVMEKILGKEQLLELDQDFQVLMAKLTELVKYQTKHSHTTVSSSKLRSDTNGAIRSLRIMLDSRTGSCANPHINRAAFRDFIINSGNRNRWCARPYRTPPPPRSSTRGNL